jgi:predicted nucleic acid-binding protein
LIVLDASAAVTVLLNLGPAAKHIRQRIEGPNESIHAPHLLDVEVVHALRRHALRGSLTPKRSAEALEDLADMRLTRYPHAPFLGRIWELRENVTAYDAVYLALAEALDAPLLTSDRRLAQAPGHRARVDLCQ